MTTQQSSDEIVTLHFEFDLGALKKLVEEAVDLNDNPAFFAKLASFQEIKNAFKTASEQLDKVEVDVKGAINARAKALYGETWQAVAGDGYKVGRQKTGAVYEFNPEAKPNKKFLKVVTSVNTDEVAIYVKENSKLPKGIEYNPSRGETLRITIKK